MNDKRAMWTYYKGEWREGDVRILGAASQATWHLMAHACLKVLRPISTVIVHAPMIQPALWDWSPHFLPAISKHWRAKA